MSERVGGPYTFLFVIIAIVSGADTEVSLMGVVIYVIQRAVSRILGVRNFSRKTAPR